jgi:hypothetical protein
MTRTTRAPESQRGFAALIAVLAVVAVIIPTQLCTALSQQHQALKHLAHRSHTDPASSSRGLRLRTSFDCLTCSPKPAVIEWQENVTYRMTCMSGRATEYRCWRSIDYRPALSYLSAEHLDPYLHSGQRALEIGCNRGSTALWLASPGVDILGIDINSDGLLYIHDFVMTPQCESYRERYIEGERRGWRTGNFAVPGREGGMLFIAHHHSMEEITEITYPHPKSISKFPRLRLPQRQRLPDVRILGETPRRRLDIRVFPNDRPLYGLKKFSTIIAIHLNDLPTTSPHGSYSDTTQKICEF